MTPADTNASVSAKPGTAGTKYAGFWWRLLAFLIDTLITTVVLVLIFVILGIVLAAANKGAPGGDAAAPIKQFMSGKQVIIFLFEILAFWLYYALMESSSWRATLGKRACGLVVTDADGRRLTFARATGRYFAKYISSLTFMIGYMMAGWTKRKQALHDMVAQTLVLKWN